MEASPITSREGGTVRLRSQSWAGRPGISVGLVGALVLVWALATSGVASAQLPPPGDPPPVPGAPGSLPGGLPSLSPEQAQAIGQQMEQDREQYITFLAKNLNVDPSLVKAALEQTEADVKAARIAAVQQDVQDGKLTQEQASSIIQAIQNGPVLVPPSGAVLPSLPMPPMPSR
jgi:hypothetical protein